MVVDWWTGLVGWTGGPGLVGWTGGLDWWAGLVGWTGLVDRTGGLAMDYCTD